VIGGERPQDRLLRAGPRSLTDAELVAVLLRSGRRGASAVDLAEKLLDHTGGLPGLAAICAQGLLRAGVDRSRVAPILAAVEIACRTAASEVPEYHPLETPAAVARYLRLRYWCPDQEVAGALYLSNRHRLVGECALFRGTMDRAAVEPRRVLREGLLRRAAGFVFFHTHPAGDPKPAPQDLLFTRRLAQAGSAVGVTLVDHLIVGEGDSFTSMVQAGGW